MKETTKNSLQKMIAQVKDISTRREPEPTIEPKTPADKSVPSSLSTKHKQADHPAPYAVEKRKKHHIPFVALALVVVFISLCGFALFTLQPTALATHMRALDSTPNPNIPTPGSPESTSYDQTTAYLISQGALELSSGDSCDQLVSRLWITDNNGGFSGAPASQTSFCWNQSDFWWGNRDITCIYNPNHNPGDSYSEHFEGTITDSDVKSVGGDISVDTSKLPTNQDTCANHDEAVCYSDNASGNDQADQLIHDQTGGDDIICANNQCVSNKTGTTNECGDPGGNKWEYNKFACQIINADLRYGGKNTKYDKNHGWDRWWDSTGVAINPTAYDPSGALYLPTTLLHTGKDKDSIQPTRDRPKCNSNSRWGCSSSDGSEEQVIILSEEASFARWHLVFPSDSSLDRYALASVPPNNRHVPILWVACSSQNSGWAFPCSDTKPSTEYGGNMPFISTESHTQSLDNGQVNAKFIARDWFSGNYDSTMDSQLQPGDKTVEPGHLEYTYLLDTVKQPGITKLFPYTLGMGYILLAPVIVLIGYQFLWAAWTAGRANAMETLGRIILSISAIAVSYELCTTLITMIDVLNVGIVGFHKQIDFPVFTINNNDYTLTLVPQGENDAASFRGIALPISRWGCIGNDFVALLANKFWTDAAGFVPFVGGIAKFVGNIFNAIDVAKHIGEFGVLILSISLCTQAFVRIILLNYYVLMAPVAFGCWGLPWGVGQGVVRQWAKGFISLLFVQTVQLFILTTFPWILPNFPGIPADRFGLINTALAQLPRVIVLIAVLKVPTLMGTQATKAIAQAGTVVGGAVAAAGAAAMNAV